MQILQYTVRLPMILKYFGQLCLALAALTLVPFLVSLLFAEYAISFRYGIVISAVAVFGFLSSRLRPPQKMQRNEAMVITALIFLLSPLMMTWPVMASGLGFVDALFETVSAVTTTGLSCASELQSKPQTFLFSRAWMQWVGGLGVVILGMAILIQPGITAKRLDVDMDFDDDIIGGTRAIARRILLIYSLLTLLGIVFLMLVGTHWYTAIVYGLSAVSTGGFSPDERSLAALPNVYSRSLVILISMAGAFSLILYHRAYGEKERKKILHNRQLQGFLLSALVVSLSLSLLLWMEHGFQPTGAIYHGVLNGLSALSTAGFSTASIGDFGDSSKLVLIMAMAVGGCAGSTAGGIKVIRIIILFRLISLLLHRAAAPSNAVLEARLDGRRLETDEIHNAMSLFVLFVCATLLSWLPFLLLGYAPLDSLFEVVSALATVGLSTGITATELPLVLKAVLAADMLLGRLEIIVWLIFFHPATWIGLQREK